MAPQRDKTTGRFISAQKFAEQGGGTPPSNEVGSSSLFATGNNGFMGGGTNPDKLIASRGLALYQDMLREPNVKAALQQKTMALLSLQWGVVPPGTPSMPATPEEIEAAEYCNWVFKDFIKGKFENDIRESMDALTVGFSLEEKVWDIVQAGPWKGKWAYSNLKSKDPSKYTFLMDKFDNILKIILMDPTGKGEFLDPAKFFLFSYNKLYENPYGRSDLRAAYRAFWIKDTAWKLRSIYMERYSGNFLKASYPKGDTKGKETLLNIFQSISQESGIVYPKGYEIEVIQMASSAESEYQRAIKDCNKEILIAILGVTLTVDEGSKTGARAMGEVHKKVADLFVLALVYMVTAVIDDQLIKPLVDFNFSGMWRYPKFNFESMTAITTQDIKNLREAGVVIDDAWIYQKLRIAPPMEESEASAQVFQYHITSGSVSRNEVRATLGLEPLKGDFYEKPVDPASLMPSSDAEAQAFSEIASMVKSGPAGSKFAEAGIRTYGPILFKTDVISFAELGSLIGTDPSSVPRAPVKLQDEPPMIQTTDTTDFWRPINKFEEPADIPRVDKQLNNMETVAVKASEPAYEDMKNQVIDKVVKMDLLQPAEDEKSAAIKEAGKIIVNPKKLETVIFRTKLTSDLVGRADQAVEMKNQGEDFDNIQMFCESTTLNKIRKFAEVGFDTDVIQAPFSPAAAIKAFSGRIPMDREEFDKLSQDMKDQAFTVAGQEKLNIEKDIRPLVVTAIDEGWDFKTFKFQLDKLFTKYINPEFNQVGTVTEPTDFHTELVFRNAIMSSYNSGKDSLRQEDQLQQAFPASFYSAILDSRTSSICRALDGSIFLINDSAWESYKPQNHHNCRSTLIAINKFEFNPEELSGPPPSSVILPIGFGG